MRLGLLHPSWCNKPFFITTLLEEITLTQLQQYGFKEPFTSEATALLTQAGHENYLIGRITLEHKHSYRIRTEQGELLGTISGKYAYNAFMRKDYPAIGDWVLVEQMPGEQRCLIHQLLTRTSTFSRKMAGLEIDEQIVATNVDLVFIVMSLNHDFNVRRLERYVLAAWDSGASPVIILTKKDLCEDVTSFIEQAEQVAIGVPIYAISTLTGEGIEEIQNLLLPHKTAALMGSSGVGKSTLTNALVEEEKMTVQHIREDDSKGRHTTTHRELFVLPKGGILIDTPGMRELQLWSTEGALESSFSDIEQLADSCRFRDCSHKNEPGCAIQQALSDGSLEQARYASYVKLQREIRYLEQKTNKQAQLAETRKWKQISKQLKNKKKNRL